MNRTLVLLTLALCSAGAHAGDPEAGKAKSASCSICHGADGKAQIPMYPKLAGQNAPYLVSALKAYKNGDRKGAMAGMMTPNVANLSDADIEDLAAYYHSLQP
ncbi:MAG: cytochrome c [Burkholderiales bacterium]|nr:cytochrome c [Burkholderiales bacterium]